MRKLRGIIIILAGVGLVVLLAGAGRTVWATSDTEAIPVKLQDLMNEPEAFYGREVSFYCRFATEGKLFRKNDGVVTLLTHINLAVWLPEAQLWEKEARKSALPTVYLPRNNAILCSVVSKLKMYSRILVKGRVYETYARLPWIEISSIEPAFDGRIDNELLEDVAEALSSAKKGYAQRSINLFNKISSDECAGYIRDFSVSSAAECRSRMTSSVRSTAEAGNADSLMLVRARKEALAGSVRVAYEFYRKACIQNDTLAESTVCEFSKLVRKGYSSGKLASEDVAECMAVLSSRLVNAQDSKILLFELSRLQEISGDISSVEETLQRILKLDPQNSEANKLLSDILARKISPVTKPELQPVVEVVSSGKVLLQARELYAAGKPDQAEVLFRKIIADTNTAEDCKQQAKIGLVGCLVKLNKNSEAQKYIAGMMGGGIPQEDGRSLEITGQQISAGGRNMGDVNGIDGIRAPVQALEEFEQLPGAISGVEPISHTVPQDERASEQLVRLPSIPEIKKISAVGREDVAVSDVPVVIAEKPAVPEIKPVVSGAKNLEDSTLPEWAK